MTEKKAFSIGHAGPDDTAGAERPDTATACDDIAGEYYSRGAYAEALEWYPSALAIHE